jgi:hypothetical protein
VARLSGHEVTVRAWEAQWGREGLWCKGCRHATPPYQVVVGGRAAELRCERRATLLVSGESWLAEVARRVPLQAGQPAEVR